MTETGDRTGRLGEALGLLARDEVPAVMDAAAASVGAVRVRSELHRLHHRPGRSVTRVERATIRDRRGRTETTLVAHAHLRGAPVSAATYTEAGVELAVWAYPHDPYLPGLATAAAAATSATADRVILRSYRPTRGAVLERYAPPGGAGRRRFLKVLRPSRSGRVAEVHRRLHPELAVPRLLRHDRGVLELDLLPGSTIRRRLRSGRPVPAASMLVELTRTLNRIDPGDDRPARRPADARRVAPALRQAVPDLAPLIDDVVSADEDRPAAWATVHGDLHPGQLLADRHGPTGILDLDGVGRGRPADDAGLLVAYLEAQTARHDGPGRAAARYATELTEAFGAVVGERELTISRAHGWLALAAVAQRQGRIGQVRDRIVRSATLLA